MAKETYNWVPTRIPEEAKKDLDKAYDILKDSPVLKTKQKAEIVIEAMQMVKAKYQRKANREKS